MFQWINKSGESKVQDYIGRPERMKAVQEHGVELNLQWEREFSASCTKRLLKI